jgi:hypothetical protein
MKMCDFELDIGLLISLAKSRPVLWEMMDDIYKGKNETKKVK